MRWPGSRERHGAENLIYAGIHRDETTPHLYAYVVPLDPQGKLNCRHFLGGAKALSQMQTDFAERVGQRHGLQRGIEGSKARHTTVRQYYAALQQETPPPWRSPGRPPRPGC
ncbi:plasmid recombination protein (plasmid) [Klebsiella quasipneumoniae]|uniref:plasmid recombination protein n=1 Tax=Klebsiella quasipneumoniae TaxID=1463165 RepID=UPI0019156BB7|nr:plasmid recombination protein [Klebsiella quasipneumoniae]QQM83495.1 plasmid recombination protein [Klebsiella quasipneumoniae]